MLKEGCSRKVDNQLFNGNLINSAIFWGKALVNKLWPLLYKRDQLDLRLTKIIMLLDPKIYMTLGIFHLF